MKSSKFNDASTLFQLPIKQLVKALNLILICLLSSMLILSCGNTEKPSTPTTSKTPPAPEVSKVKTESNTKPENQENSTTSASTSEAALEKNTSPESDIQFIRDKYAIITNATNYRVDSFSIECGGGPMRLERKYNEKNELCYLQYLVCGQHGCSDIQHYFWDGELIFIFFQDSYWAGVSDFKVEHRTYFKDGKMFRCLEKEVTSQNGKPNIEELLKKTSNSEVDCTANKLTKDLQQLKTLKSEAAKGFLCQ